MKCSRTACNHTATSGLHNDGSGRRYCESCRKAINDAARATLVPPFHHPNPPALPEDFSDEARRQAATCPYLLTERAPGTDLVTGTVVTARNQKGIEDSFEKGQVIRAVVYGFTVPRGYAALLTPEGKWWLIEPAACTVKVNP